MIRLNTSLMKKRLNETISTIKEVNKGVENSGGYEKKESKKGNS